MSNPEVNCRVLRFLIESDSDQFGLDVQSGFDTVVELRNIVDALQTRIGTDDHIGFKTHVFEVFDDNTRQYIKTTKRSQLIQNLSKIRVSAKPFESFKCFVHFYDQNQKKSTFDVVIDKCYEENEKYQKIMDKCWESSSSSIVSYGQSLPTDYSFEIYDEKCNIFSKFDKTSVIPNNSIVRIICTNNDRLKKSETNSEPTVKILSRKSCDSELGLDSMSDTIIKGINKLVIDNEKKESSDRLQRQKIKTEESVNCESKSQTKSADILSADQKVKSSNGKSSSDESSTSSAASPQTSSFDSSEDMNDYYLGLSVCQCLKSNRNTLKDPPLFWKAVSNKLLNEYKLNIMDEKECQSRFEDLLQGYINVLKTAKDSIEANDVFKCFGIFNTINLNMFLTPSIYELVVDLRYKLWNGVKHRPKSSPMRRPDRPDRPPMHMMPSMPSTAPYYHSYGLTENQVNYLAYYGYFPLNVHPNPPPYHPMRGYDDYYNRPADDLKPDDHLQSLVKTQSIDEIALRERLLDSSSVDEQMATFRGRVLFTEKDFQKRNELKSILESTLKDSGFQCVLHFFGSTDNCLGFRNSDIDLFLELKKEKNFHKSLDFGTAVHYLRQVKDCLQRSLGIHISEPIESRRCPIIKLYFNSFFANSKKAILTKAGIDCDISVTNGLAIINTKLIRFYAQYDRRFQELAIILKLWAKKNGLIDGLNGFTSYALIQLLIFFCENTSPPLLPTVDQLRQVSSTQVKSVVIDGRECGFCEDIALIPKSKNEDSVLQLLAKFFKFYSEFDFTTKVIRPKTGSAVHKKAAKDLKLMHNQKKLSDVIGFTVTPFCCIEDPFNLEHNLTAGLKIECFDKFLEYVKHIALKSDSIFIPKKSNTEDKKSSEDKSSAADWGISKIVTKFDPTPDGYQPISGRYVFHSRVKHILQSVDTNPNSLVSDLLKEFYELVQFCLERVFRCRPQITINREITGEVFPFAEFTVHAIEVNAKVFDATERNRIKQKFKTGKKKTSKQRIEREVQITQQLINEMKGKDVSKCEADFKIGLICYARPSSPAVELKIIEVKNSTEINVKSSLKEMFDLIPKIIEEKTK